MRAFSDRPIRHKLALYIALASVAGLAFAAAAVGIYDVTTFRPRALRDVQTLAAILRANAIPTLIFNDPAAARENLATLANRPEISAAEVYRADHTLFAEYHVMTVSPTLPRLADTGLVSEGRRLDLTIPLESDGQALGSLRLQYDLPTFWQRLPQYALMVTVVLVAVGMTALILLLALSHSVAKPLRSLVEAFRQLATTRDLRLRVERVADDEIGQLTSEFNRMLDTLQENETALKDGALALRESETRLRLALAAANMETWALGVEAMVTDGPLADLLDRIHPQDRAAVQRAVNQALTEGGGFEVEFRTTPAGAEEEHFTILRGQAYSKTEGAPAQLLGVAQDVTERRRLERQLVESQKMEAIGNLAGGIAHDFNNLLTGMIGYLKFAQRALPAGTRARNDVDEAERAAQRAASLTSQLLSYARRQMVVPRVVNLNDRIHALENLLRPLLGEGITLETRLGEPVWPTRIDPTQLEQMIVNLAINARDAMSGAGTIVIRTRNATAPADEGGEDGQEAREFIELTITDSGTGIAPDILDRIFEPFFTTKPTGEGTGLGLAVCYGIVKQAGGEILVQSEVGAGTSFRVLLPRADIAPAATEENRETDDLPGGNETILLAEDDRAVRALTGRALREAGYLVLEAEDGPSASELARQHVGSIDLLLTDLVMPLQGGGELARELRQTRPGLPVLFISGYPEDDMAREDVLGPNALFLAKPFTPADLRRAARRLLDASRTANRH